MNEKRTRVTNGVNRSKITRTCEGIIEARGFDRNECNIMNTGAISLTDLKVRYFDSEKSMNNAALSGFITVSYRTMGAEQKMVMDFDTFVKNCKIVTLDPAGTIE